MEATMILNNLDKEKFDSLNNITLKFINMVKLGVFTIEDIQLHKLDTEYGELYITKYYTNNSTQLESLISQRIVDFDDSKWGFIPIMKYSLLLIQKDKPIEYIGLKGSYNKYVKILIDSLNKVDKSLIDIIDNPMEKVKKLFKELNKNLPNNVYFPIEMYRIIHNDYEDISEKFIDTVIEKLGFNLFFVDKMVS